MPGGVGGVRPVRVGPYPDPAAARSGRAWKPADDDVLDGGNRREAPAPPLRPTGHPVAIAYGIPAVRPHAPFVIRPRRRRPGASS